MDLTEKSKYMNDIDVLTLFMNDFVSKTPSDYLTKITIIDKTKDGVTYVIIDKEDIIEHFGDFLHFDSLIGDQHKHVFIKHNEIQKISVEYEN